MADVYADATIWFDHFGATFVKEFLTIQLLWLDISAIPIPQQTAQMVEGNSQGISIGGIPMML